MYACQQYCYAKKCIQLKVEKLGIFRMPDLGGADRYNSDGRDQRSETCPGRRSGIRRSDVRRV